MSAVPKNQRACAALCPSIETCQLISYEWKADRRDLVLDGRHWRELFGGSIGDAPKLGAYVCCGATSYFTFRVLCLITTLAIGGLRLYYAANGVYWLLYFNHWVVILAAAYFTLAVLLSFAAIYTTGRASSGSPIVVSICTILYAALLPSAIVSALASGLVFYTYDTMWLTTDVAIVSATDCASTFGILALVWLDLVANRQPYYASYHALIGCVFVWAYLIFTIIAYFCGMTDSDGHRYIYSYLAWGVPLREGGSVTGAKLLLCNLFIITPLFNYLYWFLVWARRRVHTSATKMVDYSV